MKRQKAEQASRLLGKIKTCEGGTDTLTRLYGAGDYREMHRLAMELLAELKEVYSAQLEVL